VLLRKAKSVVVVYILHCRLQRTALLLLLLLLLLLAA
jgi:hypothetical protein